jgi:hypothetical protein
MKRIKTPPNPPSSPRDPEKHPVIGESWNLKSNILIIYPGSKCSLPKKPAAVNATPQSPKSHKHPIVSEPPVKLVDYESPSALPEVLQMFQSAKNKLSLKEELKTRNDVKVMPEVANFLLQKNNHK